MEELQTFSLKGKELDKVAVNSAIWKAPIDEQAVKNYVVIKRKNARQWSANTKTRAEVKHTTKKVYRQKGTGCARHGMTVAAQYRGGGIVFGPKPKYDFHIDMNRKEKQAVIRSLIASKIHNNQLIVLDDFSMETPKTKDIVLFLKEKNLSNKVLFIGEDEQVEIESEGSKCTVSIPSTKHETFKKSIRNIPGTKFSLSRNVNGYDLMVVKHIVLTKSALEQLEKWLGKKGA